MADLTIQWLIKQLIIDHGVGELLIWIILNYRRVKAATKVLAFVPEGP